MGECRVLTTPLQSWEKGRRTRVVRHVLLFWHFRSCGRSLADSNFILLGLMFRDQTILLKCSALSSSSWKKCYHSILWGGTNNVACVFNPLGAFIHCFFRRICFPKLNFSELRTPYHTFTSLLSGNGKRKGGRACPDLCQLNLISPGICFSPGVRLDVQIKQCLRLRGNVHGILTEANPSAAHSKGLICPSSLLTWNVSRGKSRTSDFFSSGRS